MHDHDMFVRVWGARGSLPCPGPETVRFGGNTACVEVRCGAHVLVFDAGSGIRPLGDLLVEEHARDIDLFFSHCHYDHIDGLPYFRPLFGRDTSMRMWSGHLARSMTTRQMVEGFMRAPFFPVGPDIFRAATEYRDFRAGETLAPHPGLALRTARLHHPNGATGYRVEWGGKAVCYVTDHEHGNRRADADVLQLMDRADIAIYDATYTDEEYPEFKGFGHSTWQVGARLCREAGVRLYVPFHHRGRRSDDDLARLEAEARHIHPGTTFARENVVLRP